MRILIDVDGPLGNFTAGACRWALEQHKLTFTEDQITDYDIMKAFGLPNGWPDFIDWLSVTEFCRDMPMHDGAVAFVEELRRLGDVIAVTAPFVGVRHWESHRRDWLKYHFNIGHKDVVFAHRKELITGDVLIEDKIENAIAWGKAHPQGWPILIQKPWNRVSVDGYYEAESFDDVMALVWAKHLQLNGGVTA